MSWILYLAGRPLMFAVCIRTRGTQGSRAIATGDQPPLPCRPHHQPTATATGAGCLCARKLDPGPQLPQRVQLSMRASQSQSQSVQGEARSACALPCRTLTKSGVSQ